MNANDLTSIDQVCAFMSGTQRVVFEVAGDQQGRYDWVRRTLVKFDYSGCGKADRGVLISYLMKVSSYSRAQVKRLIKRYRETGRLTPRQRTVRGFTRRYTKVDIRLLASFPFVIRGFPRRQRLGRHQPAGRPAAGETAYRVHQVPRPAQQRQRPGGMQERSCRAQAARSCPYPATLGRPAQ